MTLVRRSSYYPYSLVYGHGLLKPQGLSLGQAQLAVLHILPAAAADRMHRKVSGLI